MEKERNRHQQSPNDRFSRMMFGDKRDGMRTNSYDSPDSHPSSIDFEAIFDNIGKLKESSQNLKPLIQKVYPFVEQFFKKK